MRRFLWAALIFCVIGGLGYAGWNLTRPSQATATPATAEVRMGTVRKTVLAAGVIEAASLVSVGAQVGGQIQSLPVELGQVMKAGDLVAQIDPEDQQTDLLRSQAALAQIEAQIVAQQANIREAELTLERKRALTDKRLTATQELEAAEAMLAVARANLTANEASKTQSELSVQSARIALERTRISAPIDGTVVAKVVREGQTLNANQSSPTVIKLAKLDTMVVKAEISEADVVNVQPGQPATFTLSGAPDRRFRATLRAIEPAPPSIADADEVDTSKAIYYYALLDVPNPDGILRIGMTAEVTIVLDEMRDVLTIPTSAISTDREGLRSVKVLGGGAAETRKVQIGLSTASLTAVVEGLAEGERVLTGGNAAGAGNAGPATPRGPGGRGPRAPSLF